MKNTAPLCFSLAQDRIFRFQLVLDGKCERFCPAPSLVRRIILSAVILLTLSSLTYGQATVTAGPLDGSMVLDRNVNVVGCLPDGEYLVTYAAQNGNSLEEGFGLGIIVSGGEASIGGDPNGGPIQIVGTTYACDGGSGGFSVGQVIFRTALGGPSGSHVSLGGTTNYAYNVDCTHPLGEGVTQHMQITLAGDCLTNDAYVKPCDQKSGGDQCQTCHKPPMARYSAHSMLASLNIEDTPFRYTPARGPNIDFTVTYNQRGDQPTTVDYPNLGPQWTFNWLSYVTDNPNDSTSAQVFVPGGGVESYSNFDEESGSYAADPQSHAVLVRVSSNPIKYEKRFPDGSVTAYAQSDTSSSPRKIFMTEIFDPVGNKVTVHYNGLSTQIQSIEDALGYETALVYDENDGMRIVGVTEPTQFGSRSASFSYNTDGQLKKITDEIGIQSQFTYTTGTNFIDSLQTPYGTSHFCSGQSGTNRWVEMTDPLGGKERVEYRDNAPGISAADSSSTVPNGFTNDRLDVGNTFYWDKKATLMYPPVSGVYDYTKARIIHWLFNSDGSVSGIASSEKAPLENRVWYAYDNQPDFAHAGPSANPTKVARILDDSSAKLWQYSYNSAGNVTQEIDPRVRVRTYSYDTNNIDLLTVHQGTDAIASYAYDPDSEPPHRPKTVTDAAGQITTYHYNSQGQVLNVTNPKSEVTMYAYDRDQNSDGDTDGYLISITSPTFGTSHAITTFTYDNAKRVHTVTNSPDNYTVTTDYDNLDRPTQITYPDGTNQQFQYTDNVTSVMTLDLTGSKDRLDRWTYRHYNGNRQMDSIIDPLGQTTLYNWCTCGSLVGITDPNGNVTTFNRDLQSRVYSKVFADSSATTYAYENTTSRLKSMTDALGQTTNYQYFGDDDPQQVSYTNALISTPTVSYTYDLNYNRVWSMADGTGTTNYHYNSPPTRGANQLYQVDGPLSNDTITYTYDELGRALTQDINGTTASVVYDSLGRLYTTTNALGTFTRLYESDVTPRLHSLTYPNGQTANYHYYDNSGDRRLQTLQHLTSGLVNLSQHDYSYDPEGQIQSWTKTLGTDETDLSFTYDDAKQLTNVSRAQDNLQSDYGYDYAGNRLSASTYTPAHGHAPNGTFFNYTANALNQLDSVAETLNTDPQDPVAITYDANGNMTYDGGNQTFEWDAANRLVAITYLDSGNRTEFAYDGLNRRVRITEIGPGITATIQPSGSSYATFNTASFLLLTGTYTLTLEGLNPTGGDNTVFVDDITLNGTLVTNGSFESPPVSNYVYRPSDATWSFQTDSGIVSNGSGFGNVSTLYGTQAAFVQFNGVISQTFNTSGGTFTLGFKAAQRGSNVQQLRVTVQPYPPPPAVVKNFVWCGSQICEERDSTGSTVTKRFFAEGEQRIGGSDAGNYYYSRDHLGSIREVTDSTGALKSQFDYDAWGNSVVVSGDMNVDFGFTGLYYHQPSGLNLSLYRAYNPTLARWISRDPIGEAGGINLYGYVANNTIASVDPLGLEDFTPTNEQVQQLAKAFGPGGPGSAPNQALVNQLPPQLLQYYQTVAQDALEQLQQNIQNGCGNLQAQQNALNTQLGRLNSVNQALQGNVPAGTIVAGSGAVATLSTIGGLPAGAVLTGQAGFGIAAVGYSGIGLAAAGGYGIGTLINYAPTLFGAQPISNYIGNFLGDHF